MTRIPRSGIHLAALCLLFVVPVTAGSPTVMVTDYQVSPAVMMPGDTGTLSFTIRSTDQGASEQQSSGVATGVGFTNTQTTAINVFIRHIHIEGNGIAILTNDFERVGDIGPGQSLPITVLIRAPDREGMYFPEIWIDTGTGIGDGTSTRYPVPVNVNTRIALQKKPDLSLEKSTPGSVIPGSDFPVTLRLRNDGIGRADDIFLTVNTSASSLSITSPANYHLDHLDPGGNATFTLRFGSDKETPLGIRILPVTIEYANADGTREKLLEHLGIPVRGSAKIAIKSLTTDPVRPNPGDPITLVIRVENTGTDRAESVKAVLATRLSGTREAFIGSIDKDRDAPAIFYVRSAEGGEIPLAINLTWDDDYGTHAITGSAAITVNPSYGPAIAAGVIVTGSALAGGAYWYLRTRKKE